MSFRYLPIAACLALAALLSACATMPRDFEQPGVSLVSVTPRADDDATPRFDIVLLVTNPNRGPLDIEGMSYRIRLDGAEVIEGAASEFPRIPAYGEAEVTVSARPNLFGGLSLLSGWVTGARDEIEFQFDARIDIGAFYPVIKVSRRGVIPLD